jgi:hypothetical protein
MADWGRVEILPQSALVSISALQLVSYLFAETLKC